MNYQIKGEPMPVVICELEAGEKMITEGGSMVWMTPNMKMETTAGGIGKAFGRMFSGENIFQNIYTSVDAKGMIAFASSFPGVIKMVEVTPDKPVICQKSSFLACTPGVELSVFFNKRFGSGIFGGEGFIMQKLTGNGIAFIEIDGYGQEYELAPGQQMIIDTGNLAMMESTCTMDIVSVKGAKNIFFGGEGLFNTIVTGPGKITVQTMPMSSFVNTISSHLPSRGN